MAVILVKLQTPLFGTEPSLPLLSDESVIRTRSELSMIQPQKKRPALFNLYCYHLRTYRNEHDSATRDNWFAEWSSPLLHFSGLGLSSGGCWVRSDIARPRQFVQAGSPSTISFVGFLLSGRNQKTVSNFMDRPETNIFPIFHSRNYINA